MSERKFVRLPAIVHFCASSEVKQAAAVCTPVSLCMSPAASQEIKYEKRKRKSLIVPSAKSANAQKQARRLASCRINFANVANSTSVKFANNGARTCVHDAVVLENCRNTQAKKLPPSQTHAPRSAENGSRKIELN
jgi:uncharacterized protein YlxW (UPF0749 family)